MNQFEIGDRIVVNSFYESRYNGLVGTIVEIDECYRKNEQYANGQYYPVSGKQDYIVELDCANKDGKKPKIRLDIRDIEFEGLISEVFVQSTTIKKISNDNFSLVPAKDVEIKDLEMNVTNNSKNFNPLSVLIKFFN